MTLIRRKIKRGSRIGQKIGYPTVNFNVGQFGKLYRQGVYKCTVYVDKKPNNAMLYFGPKMSKKGHVLEVHILNFSKKIYGEYVSFEVGKRIRGPEKFGSLEELKRQIKKDLRKL